MRVARFSLVAAVTLIACGSGSGAGNAVIRDQNLCHSPLPKRQRLLVYSGTMGYRHESITAGVEALRTIGEKLNLEVIAVGGAEDFPAESLRSFQAVAFLNTTGDILESNQEAAVEDFLRLGGGFIGVHAAADTEYDWPWYGRMLGARFASHGQVEATRVVVADSRHPATRCLPPIQSRVDEWYRFRTHPDDSARVLLQASDSTGMGRRDLPLAWAKNFGAGRVFYTALGHTVESYSEPYFLNHLIGGVLWALGAAVDK